MNQPGGGDNLLVEARSALLDALEALSEHRESVIVVGAQAVYLHTGSADVALAEATKDSDLALDPRSLGISPLVEEAMTVAGFYADPSSNQPGAWMNPQGVPVDLMVPEDFAGIGGRRAARLPPHGKSAMRRARGLEAALVDNSVIEIAALSDGDQRTYEAKVAGPAALMVAKLHKLGERQATPDRLVDKDAHDLYRILRAKSTEELAATFRALKADHSSSGATLEALAYLETMFASGRDSIGAVMAGRAEEGIGDPPEVSASVALLAWDLLDAVNKL